MTKNKAAVVFWNTVYITENTTVKRTFHEHQIFAMSRIAKLNTHKFLELPIIVSLSARYINTSVKIRQIDTQQTFYIKKISKLRCSEKYSQPDQQALSSLASCGP